MPVIKVANDNVPELALRPGIVTGYRQEGGPKQGFVMGSRTQGVQEILEEYI